ncbi:urea transporter 1-like [Panulirus ornatus]|uniref:urea transporter 1-like n=1 Tax=Panulirus ornatus TaxID=150431 RepID=UPI003A8BBB6E
MNNRRQEKRPAWLGWMGDMATITEFLLAKPWKSPWAVPKTINSIVRAIGIVGFANNPLTGVLILAGIFVGNVDVGCACLLAGVIAIIFSKALNQPEQLISDGVVVFNTILVGCISVAVFPGIFGRPIDSIFWIYLVVALIITTYVDKGLGALMAPSSLPPLSIPFNIAAALLLLTLHSVVGQSGSDSLENVTSPTNLTSHTNSTEKIDWLKVMEGTLLAAGQIYGVGTIDSSILIYLGFLVYSPLLTVFFFMGSVIGTVTGALVSTAPYTNVYLGLWGYNAMLTAGGISYFLVPTPGVVLASVVGATMAAGVQVATMHIFRVVTVKVLSYPFNVAMLIILAISTTKNPPFTWVAEKTFPEHHVFLHIFSHRKQQTDGVSSQEPEELLQINHK